MKDHIFNDSNVRAAIASASQQVHYRTTHWPEEGPLLYLYEEDLQRQPWILRMPLCDWGPFLEEMMAAGKELIPDPDKEDPHDTTPAW